MPAIRFTWNTTRRRRIDEPDGHQTTPRTFSVGPVTRDRRTGLPDQTAGVGELAPSTCTPKPSARPPPGCGGRTPVLPPDGQRAREAPTGGRRRGNDRIDPRSRSTPPGRRPHDLDRATELPIQRVRTAGPSPRAERAKPRPALGTARRTNQRGARWVPPDRRNQRTNPVAPRSLAGQHHPLASMGTECHDLRSSGMARGHRPSSCIRPREAWVVRGSAGWPRCARVTGRIPVNGHRWARARQRAGCSHHPPPGLVRTGVSHDDRTLRLARRT